MDDVVGAEARALRAALGRYVIASFGMPGYPGFEAGRNGVALVFPRPKAWQEYAWYTPDPTKAPWTGNWAFLRDGATPANGVVENWSELLHAWFDAADGVANRW